MFSPAFMTSFFHPDPIFRPKSPDITRKKHDGAIYLSAFSPLGIFPAQYYTRIDQALWIWGVTVALIFIPAQFLSLDWRVQAVLWSSLSIMAIATTHWLTWCSHQYHHLRWVMKLWAGLMLVGVAVSNYGVFGRQGWILGHMCDIWLGLCSAGYMISAIGMRSRPLAIISGIHSVAILLVNAFPQWMFLGTGIVMSWSLVLLAELWWDHR